MTNLPFKSISFISKFQMKSNFDKNLKDFFNIKLVHHLILITLIVINLPNCKCQYINESAPTVIKPQNTHYTVKYGETLIIPCEIENRKQATVIWQYSKSRIPETLTIGYFYYRKDYRIRVITNATNEKEQSWNLEIRKVRFEDEGYYLCKVMAQSKSLKRVVYVRVEVEMSIQPMNSIVNLKDSFTLTCNTSLILHESNKSSKQNQNQNHLRLTWFKDGEALSNDHQNHHHHNHNNNNNNNSNNVMPFSYKIEYFTKPSLASKLKVVSLKPFNKGLFTCKFKSQNVSTIVSAQNVLSKKFLEFDNNLSNSASFTNRFVKNNSSAISLIQLIISIEILIQLSLNTFY